MTAGSYFDWVLPVAAGSPIFEYVEVNDEELQNLEMACQIDQMLDEKMLNNFDTSVVYDKETEETLHFMDEYHRQVEEEIPTKVSVSDLKKKSMEEGEEEEQERNIHFRTNRRIFAKVDEIFLLEKPIDISEFSDFIFVSRQSAITPVVGSDFDRLKKIICSKNEIPDYLKKSRAIPLPLQKINPENWLDVTQEYRRLFALEIQFRRFYVDYFLRVLGQQKTFYAECECYQQGRRTGFADNAIKIGGKWCFVEVKLNVHTEPHLHDQLKKYCHAEGVILQKGERTLPQEKVWQNTMLVIDTEDFYIYSVSSDQLTLLESLDKIKTESNIKALQKRILPLLN